MNDKLSPKYQIASKDGGSAGNRGSAANGASAPRSRFLDIVNISSLRDTEKRRVEKIAQQTAPQAKIIGAATPGKTWDIRPVVATEGKENSGEQLTSLIRFFGPECSLVLQLQQRIDEQLKLLAKSNPRAAVLINFGSLDGQLWYRRAQIPEVLSEKLDQGKGGNGSAIGFIDAMKIAKGILSAVSELHECGVIHGHVVPNNVFVAPGGEVGVIDPLFALAACQASISLDTPELISGYDTQTIAPEALLGRWPDKSIDIFGIGKTFWELFRRVKRGENANGDENVMTGSDLQLIRELIFSMTDDEPSARPSLDSVMQTLSRARQIAPAAKAPVAEKAATVSKAPTVGKAPMIAKGPTGAKTPRVSNPWEDDSAADEPTQSAAVTTPPTKAVAPSAPSVTPTSEPTKNSGSIPTENRKEGRGRDRTLTEAVPSSHLDELRRRANHVTNGRVIGGETRSHEVQAPLGAFGVKSRILRSGGNVNDSRSLPQHPRGENIGEVFFSLDEPSEEAVSREELEKARRAAVDSVFDEVDGDAFAPQPRAPGPVDLRITHLEPSDATSAEYEAEHVSVSGFADEPEEFEDEEKAPRDSKIAEFRPRLRKTTEQFFTDDDSADEVNDGQLADEPEFSEEFESEPKRRTTAPVADQDRPKRSIPWGMVMGAVIVGLFGWSYLNRSDRAPEHPETPADMRDAWESSMPSRMKEVALLAVGEGEQSRAAQDILVGSAFKADKSAEILGGGSELLRVAYDKRWEIELSPTDRREAVRFAAIGFLGDQAFANGGGARLETLHPGVILALAATLKEAGGKVLSGVPALVLGKLPYPLGAAFAELSQSNSGISVGDVGVRRLARLAAGGEISAESLKQFLNEDTAARLRAVAQLGAGDKVLAGKLLGLLFNHPNVRFEGEQFNWARVSKLLGWEELDSSDQLLSLAGIPPTKEVAVAHIPWLRGHPASTMRQYALQQTLDRIKLGHPGGFEILSALKEQPDALSPSQTFDLAWVLQTPRSVGAENARKWLETEVPLGVLERMVVSASTSETPAFVDLEVMTYLQSRSWDPSKEVLETLSQSPQRYFRLFAFMKLYRLADKSAALQVLEKALTSENDPELKKQLQQMTEILRHAAK